MQQGKVDDITSYEINNNKNVGKKLKYLFLSRNLTNIRIYLQTIQRHRKVLFNNDFHNESLIIIYNLKIPQDAN